MSDPNSPDPNRDLPPSVPAPPPPRPDLKDPRLAGATYGTQGAAGSKGKKKKQRHPTDAYPPLKRRRGGCGCGGCLGGTLLVLALLFVAGVVALGYFGPGRFVKEGYKVVNLESAEAIVETAPTEPTFYLAQGTLTWRVPVTTVPVALCAREIHIEGDFHDEASVTGLKVTATEKARFAKNLEVVAAEFTDLGITLKGELTGHVMKNLP